MITKNGISIYTFDGKFYDSCTKVPNLQMPRSSKANAINSHNSSPSPLNPKPYSLNPRPWTLDPKPENHHLLHHYSHRIGHEHQQRREHYHRHPLICCVAQAQVPSDWIAPSTRTISVKLNFNRLVVVHVTKHRTSATTATGNSCVQNKRPTRKGLGFRVWRLGLRTLFQNRLEQNMFQMLAKLQVNVATRGTASNAHYACISMHRRHLRSSNSQEDCRIAFAAS